MKNTSFFLNIIFIFAVSLFVFHNPVQSEAAVIQEKDGPLVKTRNNYFSIPFEIKPESTKELPREVELTYSTDRGMSWLSGGRVSPESRQFLFRAPSDGEYWFNFKTYGSDGNVKQPNQRGPMLRVLIDTVPPQLQVSGEQKSTGEVHLKWSIEDTNLPRRTPKVQLSYYVPSRDSLNFFNWKPLAIDPMSVETVENRHTGEVIFWPEHEAVSVEIHAEIVDSSGNREMQSRTLTLNPTLSRVDGNLLSKSMESQKNALNPTPQGSRAVALTPPKPIKLNPTIRPQTTLSLAGTTGPSTSESVEPLEEKAAENKILTVVDFGNAMRQQAATKAKKGGGSVAKAAVDELEIVGFATPLPMYGSNAAANSETEETAVEKANSGDELILGAPLFYDDYFGAGPENAAETRKTIAPEDFQEPPLSLDDLAKIEPVMSVPRPRYESGPDALELNLDLEIEPELPPAVEPEEPVAAEEPELVEIPEIVEPQEEAIPEPVSEPEPQAQPQSEPKEIVQKAVPEMGTVLKISKVSLLSREATNQILVKWDADPKSWTAAKDVKIHLLRGRTPEGPWTPIAKDLKNTGSYSWNVSREDRLPFYVLLQGEGSENRSAIDATQHPIRLPESR